MHSLLQILEYLHFEQDLYGISWMKKKKIHQAYLAGSNTAGFTSSTNKDSYNLQTHELR